MELRFESQLEYQLDAINSISGLFRSQRFLKNQSIMLPENGVVRNQLDISQSTVLENLQEIQIQNGMRPSSELEGMNFSVEMETGTGKTYVYLRTIFELNRSYGFKKFIIIVPSVAIREGVIKTLKITQNHFGELYDHVPYNYATYDSRKIFSVRHFARSNKIEILVMTIDSFNKDTNIMNIAVDKLSGQKPIELISKTRPILILDEPQNMESEKSKLSIENLTPLFTLRYSATHRHYYNLVYRLTPVDAYNRNLVKKIEVSSVVKEDDFNSAFVRCLEIRADSKGIKAVVEIHKKLKSGFKASRVTIKNGDDLSEKSGSEEYSGFLVSEINAKYGFVRFSNGITVETGDEVGGDRAELMKVQVEQAVEEHFRKAKVLKQHGVKPLTLFFIDRVDNYLLKDGIIRKYFVDAFNELKGKFPEFSKMSVDEVHSGYFSKMKSTAAMQEDREAFDLIMRNKERLLSFDEPVQFIFSHSALREGWDNPNIFNICTLNQTISDIKKRQEIGRGMRLPVNQEGQRVFLGDHNVLTVIANEKYSDYVSKLQKEYIDEYGELIAPPKPANARNRTTMKLKKEYQLSPDFKELWRRISKRTKYAVNIDTQKLIEECVKEINERISVKAIKIKIEKVSLLIKEGEGVTTTFRGSGHETLDKEFPIPNIVDHLSEETYLTKETCIAILDRIKNLQLIFTDPQEYVASVTLIIKEKLADFLVNGIQYLEVDDWYKMQLFNDIETYTDFILPVERSIYDGIICDSKTERNFAEKLNGMPNVKMFIKLPDWFVVQTPIGEYNPDWAVVMENVNQFGEVKEKLYFVTETKGSAGLENLRPSEKRKIGCAEKHFRAIDVDYSVVERPEELVSKKLG